MIFLLPLGLLGLISLPLIFALHLLRERRKRFVVSSTSLWAFLQPEVRGERLRRIPFSWLLFLDLLIATLLSLALAQPQIPAIPSGQQGKHLIILLDTSTSMLTKDLPPNRFFQARLKASSLLRDLTQQDMATLITFGREAHWIGDTRQIDLSALINQVSTLEAGETGSALTSALALAQAAMDPTHPADIEILTDQAFPTEQAADFPYPIHWIPFGGNAINQAVVDVSAINGNDGLQVFARLANYHSNAARRVVSLLVDGKIEDTTTVVIPGNTTIPQVWTEANLKASEVTISLDPKDDLREDDSATIGLLVKQNITVALVRNPSGGNTEGTPDVFERAFKALPNVQIQTIALKDYILQKNVDLTVFEGGMPVELPPGLILVADLSSGISQGISRSQAPIDSLQIMPGGADLLEGVDFSGVRWGGTISPPAMPIQMIPLLELNQTPLLEKGQMNKSQIYFLLAELPRSNFTEHPSFPILLGKLANLARRPPLPAKRFTGDRLSLSPLGASRPVKVIPPQGQTIELTTNQELDWDQTRIPGAYKIVAEDLAGQPTVYSVGFNAGEINESNVNPQPLPSPYKASTTGTVNLDQQPLQLFPWLLGAALVGLLLEAWLAWK